MATETSIKRAILPMALAMAGTMMLVGCLYIPTFEHAVPQSNRDFRGLVGDCQGRAIRPGYVDRKTVLLLLGPPTVASSDGNSIGYFFQTQHDAWVWPLCFAVEPARNKLRGLRLDFGKDDVLLRYKLVAEDQDAGGFLWPNWLIFPYSQVMEDLAEPGSPLLWRGHRIIQNDRDFDQQMSNPAIYLQRTTMPTTQPIGGSK